MTRLFFINGEPVTKAELLINAEKQTEKTKSKNKRRLREGLTFRLARDYSSWSTFIGGCQPISHKSVKHVSLDGIIANALKNDHITEPCVAIFRLKNKNFIYSDRSDQPIIINGHVLVDRGGTWRWYVDEDGYMIWYVEGADGDRIIRGEHLLVDPIPFPRTMSVDDRKAALDKYGQLFDRYHIVSDCIIEDETPIIMPTRSGK